MSFFRKELLYFLITLSKVWGQQLLLPAPASSDCADAEDIKCDVEALEAIKKRLDDTSKKYYQSWKGDNPCDGTWLHVECDESKQRVTKLALGKKHWELEDGSVNYTRIDDKQFSWIYFDQALPIELTKMHYLQYMEFSHSNFSGSIFPEISAMTNLVVLDLESNIDVLESNLTGRIPSEISALKNLQVLDVYQNKLTGNFSAEISTLSNLKFLIASINNLTGSIPIQFSQLKKLEDFSLAKNQITGSLPVQFSQLLRLKKLSLSNNLINGSLPIEYQELLDLEQFIAEYNSITGTLPDQFRKLQNLEEFVVNDNLISGNFTMEYSELVNLTKLSVSNNYLTGTLPSQYSNLTNLKQFYVQHNEISGSLPEEYCELHKLEKFVVSENIIEGSLPVGYYALDNLVKFSVGDNNIIGSLPENYSTFLNLQEMYLYNNSITGSLPPEYAEFQNLTYFLADNNNIIGILPEEFMKLQNLEEFVVNNNHISGSLRIEYYKLVNLTKLSVSNNSITGNLPPQYSDLTNLQELYVQHNEVTGSLPLEYSQLQKLKQFVINDNMIRGSLPVQYSELVDLVKISSENNIIFGTLPEHYSKLKNLTMMYVQRNCITGTLPVEYSEWSNGTEMNIRHNLMTGTYPDEYSTLKIFPKESVFGTNRIYKNQCMGGETNTNIIIIGVASVLGGILFVAGIATIILGVLWTRRIQQNIGEEVGDITANIEEGGAREEETTDDTEQETGTFVSNLEILTENIAVEEGNEESTDDTEQETDSVPNVIQNSKNGLQNSELKGLSDLVDKATQERNLGVDESPSWWTNIRIPAEVREIPMTDLQEVQLLGTGGFAWVYEVVIADNVKDKYYDLCDKHLALKIIHKEITQKHCMEAIIQEILVMQNLSNEHVVQFIGASLHLRPSIVMELVPEGSLDRLLQSEGFKAHQTSLQWKLEIMLNISKGIRYLHSQGITHRDLKPQNILVKDKHKAEVKISDFGLSKIMKTESSVEATRGVGTMQYMAPEMFDKRITQKVDIWALGVIMQEIIRGVKPWSGDDDPYIICRLSQHKEPPANGELPQEGCPQELRSLINNCWNEVERCRPTADEVANELDDIFNKQRMKLESQI